MKKNHFFIVAIVIVVLAVVVGDLILLATRSGTIANLCSIVIPPIIAGWIGGFLNKNRLSSKDLLGLAAIFVSCKLVLFFLTVSDPLLGAALGMVAVYGGIVYVLLMFTSSYAAKRFSIRNNDTA